MNPNGKLRLTPGGLIIPPTPPIQTLLELWASMGILAFLEYGIAAAMAYGMWRLGAPVAALAVLVTLLAAYQWWVLPGRVRHIGRAVRHARRWHTEPLYRDRWENEE